MGVKGPFHWFIIEAKDLQAVAQEPQGFCTERLLMEALISCQI